MIPESSKLPLTRTRLSLALVCFVGVALELTFMRGLALEFYSNFAGMVISVGLLGFGAAGTLLSLFRSVVLRRQQAWLAGLALGLCFVVPVTWWVSQSVKLDVGYLAWNWTSQSLKVLAIELSMSMPFLLAGAFVGIALMDAPGRINGHYASDLAGSGAGGILAVLAMNWLGTVQLLLVLALLAGVAALIILPWRKWTSLPAAALVFMATFMVVGLMPREPSVFDRKMLVQTMWQPGSKDIFHEEGPLGQLDVVSGPTIHWAPGMSVQWTKPVPPHVLLMVDGSGPSSIFDCRKPDDWQFMDWRTASAPYWLPAFDAAKDPRVCIIGGGGGSEIGLAVYHNSPDITALEMNPQIISAMRGPLRDLGGSIYDAPGVHIVNQEARGFFASGPGLFDVIQLQAIDSFGAAGAGLYASQESYLYTVESFRGMLDHLSPTGVLCVNRWVQDPPREELRAFDTSAQALRAGGLDPATHIMMIRNQFAVTIVLFRQAITPQDIAAMRSFCDRGGFDMCYLPGLTEKESNVWATVHSTKSFAGYFQTMQTLLAGGDQRAALLAKYPFEIAAPIDDKPYFFHTFKWGSWSGLKEDYGEGANAFLELGYVLLLAALIQAVLLALVLVILPLVPRIHSVYSAPGKGACLGYFMMLGLGFMLLEMGFVQKLALYLAHPIYAAAVVIASFLFFAGLGSFASSRWPRAADRGGENRMITVAVCAIVAISVAFLLGLDAWLSLTQAWGVPARCLVAALTIGPLAFAMGHLFPLGLKRAAGAHESLVPWSWAINGFASVVASSSAPLIAMAFGFSRLALLALGCYVLAAILFRRIPQRQPQSAAEERTNPAIAVNG